ncbi:MAG: hypothetical protein ACXWDN_06285 [Limisphaerales bacterium]
MPSRISRALLFVVLGLLSACTGHTQSLHKTNGVEVALYDADPTHVANRVYKALFVWKTDEEAPPSHWPKQKIALDTVTLKAALDELLQANISKEFPDPVKRVFLQRDLWLTFDWLAQQSSSAGSENPVIERKLVRCIQHIALPLAQLRQLPDNYDEQLTSDTFPIEFDHSNPNTPFLPGGLLARSSSWIMIGDRDTRGILAAQHVDFFRGHNAYMIFVRLPAGRAATISYLNKLTIAATAHSKLPELPEGTQMALISQVMAIDDKGMPFPTTITESVQVRVYRQPKSSLTMANDAQSRFEFRLDRGALFAHKPATLRPIGAKETDWEFINYLGQKKTDAEGKGQIMASCFDCHNEPGVESFKTFTEMRNTRGHIGQLTLSKRSEEAGRTVTWKKRQRDFQLLRQFWAE